MASHLHPRRQLHRAEAKLVQEEGVSVRLLALLESQGLSSAQLATRVHDAPSVQPLIRRDAIVTCHARESHRQPRPRLPVGHRGAGLHMAKLFYE